MSSTSAILIRSSFLIASFALMLFSIQQGNLPLSALAAMIAGALFSLQITSAKLQAKNREIVQARAALKESQEQYRLLTDNLAAAVVIRDAQGKIKYCSPFTEVLTGYAVSEIYSSGEDFFIFIAHEQDRSKYKRALQISSAGEAFQFRSRLNHKTGIELWVETRTVPILDFNGSLLFSLSITLDITASVRYQRQVEEQNRDLKDFTYMVSHDLKAPIATIRGMTQVLKEELQSGPLSKDLSEALDHISSATKRLEQLVSSILEYSRLSTQEFQFKAVDLSSVFADLSNDLAGQILEAKASLILPEETILIFGDPIRTYQVFSNLLSNALKYRSPDRKCEIEIKIERAPSPSYVQLCVHDNGLGINSDKLSSIFRPFQRAHYGKVDGTGIGLACVKKIMDKFEGRLWVESKEGESSSFHLVFPKAHKAV